MNNKCITYQNSAGYIDEIYFAHAMIVKDNENNWFIKLAINDIAKDKVDYFQIPLEDMDSIIVIE